MARNTTEAQKAQENIPEVNDRELEQEAGKLETMAQNAQGAGMDQMMQAMLELKAQIAGLQKDLDAQKKENEELKKNSVYSPSPMGGRSDWDRVHDACRQVAENHEDPWSVKISVLSPRIGKGEDAYWLCINGKSVAIPANDRYFEMALPFAECLVNEIEARYRAADMIDKMEVYDPKENPHPVEKIV